MFLLLFPSGSHTWMNLYVYFHAHSFTREFHWRILSAQTDGRREACRWILGKRAFFSLFLVEFDKLNISKSLFFVSVFVVLLFLFSFSKLIRHQHSMMILYGYSSHNNQASYSATNVVDLWIVRNNRVLICKILDLHGRYQCFTFFIYICIFMYIRILKLASAANSARFFFFRIWKQTKEARSIERTREIFDWAIEYFVTVCG